MNWSAVKISCVLEQIGAGVPATVTVEDPSTTRAGKLASSHWAIRSVLVEPRTYTPEWRASVDGSDWPRDARGDVERSRASPVVLQTQGGDTPKRL